MEQRAKVSGKHKQAQIAAAGKDAIQTTWSKGLILNINIGVQMPQHTKKRKSMAKGGAKGRKSMAKGGMKKRKGYAKGGKN